MTCPACTEALSNPETGYQHADCRGCQVRAMSQAPRFIRQRYFDLLPEGDREQFEADVVAEYKRRKAMKESA